MTAHAASVALFVLVGCQSGESKPAPPAPVTKASGAPSTGNPIGVVAPTRNDEPYKRDVDRICNVVELSGAAEHDGNDRQFLIASYLGKNLETSDAQQWLVSLKPLGGGEPMAAAYEQEARRVGIATCPVAAEWRKPK